ncbi:MAG: RNA polymerase-binding protein DksA [Epsilonproteobacteria bacterium]|nr:RNA polymerase-binding protein DksA [Campylobacterota bacterium]
MELKEELLILKEKLQSNIRKANSEIDLMRNQTPTDEGDFAVLTNDSTLDFTLIEKQVKELEEIEVALDKILNGNYGICEMCEEPIGIERLRVKPYAKFCIVCREINEKSLKK